jgi:clan AA aspartic protease
MGLVYTNIELIRGADFVLCREGYLKADQIKRLSVKALVDSGAYMLAINQSIKAQLNLQAVDEQIAELADGTQIRLEVVGPVEIHFENRRAMVDAMVLPGEAEVLLGAIPMEEMDVMVDPKQQQLRVNPASPYITKKSLK